MRYSLIVAFLIVFGTFVPRHDEVAAYVSDEPLFGLSRGAEGWLYDFSENAYGKEPSKQMYESFIETYGNDYKIRTVVEGVNSQNVTEVHFILSNVPIQLTAENVLKTSDGSDFVVLNYNDFQIENVKKETSHQLSGFRVTWEKKTGPVETAIVNLPSVMSSQTSIYVLTGLFLLSMMLGVLVVKRTIRIFYQH